MNHKQRGQRVRPARKACMDCHARKVKCDSTANGAPCSNCKTAGIECIVVQRRSRKKATPQGPRVPDRAAASTPAITSTSVSVHGDVSDPGSNPVNAGSAGPGREVVAPETPASTTAPEFEGDCELARQHLVDFFNQDLKEKPIMARSTYVGNELSNLNYLTRQRPASQQVYHYPCSAVHVPRVFRNSQPQMPNLIPKDAFVLPPKHVSDVLVADYFQIVHPHFPIIDRERFLAQYGEPSSPPSILLLQAICLVGSHVTRRFDNKHDLKVAFFRRAKALVDGRYEEDRMHVVQAALLFTWFSDGGDDICANAWWWIGVAAKAAIGLGMHRDVGPSKMPENDKRTWKMIWWTLVQFDCLVSLCHGRPQSINLDDCDVPPLTPEDFDSSISTTSMHFVIQHSKLCSMVSDLLRSHMSVKARKNGAAGQNLLSIIDTALADWMMELPPELRGNFSHLDAGRDPGLCFLHLTYNTVLIQFHRALSSNTQGDATATTGPGTATSDEEICAEAAANITRIFAQLDQHSSLSRCWFWAPSALFTAMLQLAAQLSRSPNPILALRIRENYDSGLLSLRKLARHWLFATSVLRLFQSSPGPPFRKTANRDKASLSTTNPVTAETASPAVTVSSFGAMSTEGLVANSAHDPSQADWIALLEYEDPAAASHMNVEPNRWEHSLEQWQTLYWSDPLSNVHLEDNFGDMQVDWPGFP